MLTPEREGFTLRSSLVAVIFRAIRSNFRSWLEMHALACMVIKCHVPLDVIFILLIPFHSVAETSSTHKCSTS